MHPPAAAPAAAPDALRVTALDVGQGDATLLQAGGHAVLVDAGPPGGADRSAGSRAPGSAASTCSSSRTRRPTTTAARPRCCAALPVGLLLDGRDGVRAPTRRRWTRRAPRVARARSPAHAGERAARRARSRLRVLWPPPGAGRRRGADPNDRAIVARRRARRRPRAADRRRGVRRARAARLRPVDVLKVAHHGSDDPGLPALLARLRPRVALIEVGARNTYGHPTARDHARRCRAPCPRSCRTDRDGTVRARRARRPGDGGDDALEAAPVPRPQLDCGRWRSLQARLPDPRRRPRPHRRAPRQPARASPRRESGAGGVEVFEGEAATPEAVAQRAERDDVRDGPAVRRSSTASSAGRTPRSRPHVAPALAGIGADTTVAFFAREDGRAKAPAGARRGGRKAGGDVAAEATLKARELPRWVAGRGRSELGIELDGAAAQALVAPRRRAPAAAAARAREAGARARPGRARSASRRSRRSPPTRPSARSGASSTRSSARDRATAAAALPRAARAGRVAAAPDPADGATPARGAARSPRAWRPGESPAQVKASTKGNPWAPDRRIKEARPADPDALRRALEALADLELDTRGGSELDDDTGGARAMAAAADRRDGVAAARAARAATARPRRGPRAAGGAARGARRRCRRARARRGTSCGRRCCGAARRA